MLEHETLKRITSLTATTISAFISLMIPMGFFIIIYHYESRLLEEQANYIAESISSFIYLHPETWQFQEYRLEDILVNGAWHRKQVDYQIFDHQDNSLIIVGNASPLPHYQIITPLTDGNQSVGRIELNSSLRPLLYDTGMVAIFSLFLGWLIHYVLRILPFAALETTMLSLQESRQQLIQEMAEKEQLFEENVRINKTLKFQALHDILTGLPNRAQFNHHLARSLTQFQVDHQGMLSVMMVDLDRFKEVNDSLGHEIGDKVLIEVAHRFRAALSDSTLLARLGGDEFALISVHSTVIEAAAEAEFITNSLLEHIDIDGYHINMSSSIGIAHYPQHGVTPKALLRHADVAMYHAKQTAQNYCIYQDGLDDSDPNRLMLTAYLREAIDKDELTLVFQPKINLVSGETIGLEVLTRWQHSKLGVISPNAFIPLAEQSGIINNLTDWVIERALQQLSTWQNLAIQLSMSINISAKNLQNNNLSTRIKALLEHYQINPQCLILEITESSIMIDPVKSMELINSLAEWGIKISIDDFGTGYSSLAYLKKLTAHELKIDRSFVINMLNVQDDQIIVRSTIDLAHNLNMIVVAEGIEDQQTLELLQDYGCDLAQGYHISKPQPADSLEDWIIARQHFG